MKLHGDKNEPDDARRMMNIDASDQSSNQQLCIPVFSGEAKLPCMWIGVIYNQFVRQVRQERPGKK